MDFNTIKGYISWAGGLLALYGIISIIIWFTPYEIRAIAWINAFGVMVSWIFRIAFVVGGGALFLIFRPKN